LRPCATSSRSSSSDTKSIIHFVNNQFYYQKTDDKALTSASSINSVNNYNDMTHLWPTSAEIILKQINNNKISFKYLSHYTDLKLFLTSRFSNIDTSYTISNVQESLSTFTQFIVGQSIFTLRYCALRDGSRFSRKYSSGKNF